MSSLSRKKGPYTSLIRNLATSLVLYERITTTEAKAKEVRGVLEHIINQSRENTLSDKRRLLGFFFDKNAVKKVIEEIIPRYKNDKTGIIQSYRFGTRKGDNASMMILEFKKVEIKESEGKNANETDEKDGKTAGDTSTKKPSARVKAATKTTTK